jgi:hypothetical protein
MPVYEYIALLPLRPAPSSSSSGSSHLGRALALSFVISAAALSVLGMTIFWWFGECGADGGSGSVIRCDPSEDDATLAEGYGNASTRYRGSTDSDGGGRAAGHWQCSRPGLVYVGGLIFGTATRLLLGALGTTAMICVISDRGIIMKRGSFIAVEVLGWLLV